MAYQTILFTVMPRGMRLNPDTMPVSVLVSPRLVSLPQANTAVLGDFPDWLNWTQRLKDSGLQLTFRCGSQSRTLEIDSAPLRPELWAAMFNAETFVRSHTFQDYTERAIISYPERLALSALKSIYQQAGVSLGLPDRRPVHEQERGHSPYRQTIKSLLSGFGVNWSDEKGERLRKAYRDSFARLAAGFSTAVPQYGPAMLAPDGTLNNLPQAGTPAAQNLNSFVAAQFAVYSHMPQGAPIQENPPDFDTLIDFHQALSSLNSYPELLRALGLVFDFELPTDFVAHTPIQTPGRLAVIDVPGQVWAIETRTPSAGPGSGAVPPLETAYLYFDLGSPSDPWRIFTTAPGLLGGGLSQLEVFGLLNLDPGRYGLAQVDLESGLNKTILLAEAWGDDRPGPHPPDRPDVFDETTTLPSLRSGGFSLFADGRALRLLKTFKENKSFNTSLESSAPLNRPFFAEDLIHGFRLDIWDSNTDTWHSLHKRNASYQIGEEQFDAVDVEGFTQLAAGQAAPDPNDPTPDDLYLNESAARWMGWSLSVPFPGKSLSRDPDPAKALQDDPDHPPNEPATPFKMATRFSIIPGSLPALRFGRRYRLRVRPVDLCGGSLEDDDPLAHLLALLAGLPRDPEGFPYLRYEPVVAPGLVLRDARAVTDPGSQLERLVMRTWNDDPSKDSAPADLTASDRFIAPPGASVELGERLGMFDDPTGKLVKSPAMYNLIASRDAGKFNHEEVEVAGQPQSFPLESGETIDVLPYLPDVLARGAALRDLPGAPEGSLAAVEPGAGPSTSLPYAALEDANPRPGSAALISFSPGNTGLNAGDWQKLQPFRLALADGMLNDVQPDAPAWDPQARVLTVFLPKAAQALVPLSSYLLPDDLKLMGVWQWLREYIDKIVVQDPEAPTADPNLDSEKIAHLLQRAVEGGHWMITPPRLLQMVHAVQQPIGRPEFTALSAQHEPYGGKGLGGSQDEMVDPDPNVLQTAPEASPTPEGELAPITAWRKPGSQEAVLLGGLKVHALSTAKIDLLADWDDPFDDPSQPREDGQDYIQKNTAQVDEIPIPRVQDGIIDTGQGTSNYRRLAYYDADQDLLCFARGGDRLGNLRSGITLYSDTAPRHHFNDTKRHRVRYTARAASRFREYFPQDQDLDFTRSSPALWVDVPASARPAAPLLEYVVPTFGWQRQSQTNLKRSNRFGGGLRVYLERPWFSSGEGELLGVVLYDYGNGSLDDREIWKPFVTQWGADPVWQAPGLAELPAPYHFPNAAATEGNLSLPGRAPGRVRVAGFPVFFDYESQRWFADLTVDTQSLAYTPFLRMALVRYQPHALPDAKLSPVVLADYAQLTPQRSAVLTADPYHPRRLRLTVSGPAPSGPAPTITGAQPAQPVNVPTLVTITVQQRNPSIQTDLGWEDHPAAAAISAQPLTGLPGLVRWTGTVDLAPSAAAALEPGQLRVLVREYEYLSANYTLQTGRGPSIRREQPRRLIYAEAIEIDRALIGSPTADTGTVLEEE